MTSIALGVFIVFIIYVMIWSIRNDGARSIREQTGFIRMRVPAKSADAKTEAAEPQVSVTSTAKAKRASAKGPGQRRPTPSRGQISPD
ncbi:MAG: hypothetical protein ACFB13_04365 [Kiloniellaceae bacterium]